MTIAEVLTDLVLNALTRSAALSALHTLRLLAISGDFSAVRSIASLLARQLGFAAIQVQAAFEVPSAGELLVCDRIPALIRLYSIGFTPEVLAGSLNYCRELGATAIQDSRFDALQALVRCQSPIRHEALKAHLLAVLFGARPELLTRTDDMGKAVETLMEAPMVADNRSDFRVLQAGAQMILRAYRPIDFVTKVASELVGNIKSALILPRQPAGARVLPGDSVIWLKPWIVGHAPPAGILTARWPSDRVIVWSRDPDRTLACLSQCASGAGGLQSTAAWESALGAAVRCGDAKLVQALLSGRQWLNPKDENGRSYLRLVGHALAVLAVEEQTYFCGPSVAGIEDVIDAMLNSGTDVNCPVNAEGDTPLIGFAAHSPRAMRVFLAHRANLDAVNARGETAVHVAARSGAGDVLQELLAAHPNLEARANDGFTALVAAIETGAADTVRLLLDAGADVEASVPPRNQTPLQCAARVGQLSIVRALLQAGADVHAADKQGATALHHALELRSQVVAIEVLKALLENGADVNEENSEGLTPLMLAAWNGQSSVLAWLLSAGADVHARTVHGQTVLHLASDGREQRRSVRLARGDSVSGGHSFASKQASCIQALLEAGADVSAADDYGRTPLHFACAGWEEAPVEALLGAKAPVNAPDHKGDTPLILSVKNMPLGINAAIRALLAAGADPHYSNARGESAAALLKDRNHSLGAPYGPPQEGQTPQ
jgi:ankyrin repeat protein